MVIDAKTRYWIDLALCLAVLIVIVFDYKIALGMFIADVIISTVIALRDEKRTDEHKAVYLAISVGLAALAFVSSAVLFAFSLLVLGILLITEME